MKNKIMEKQVSIGSFIIDLSLKEGQDGET